MDSSELHHLVVGWMLEDRPAESTRDDDGKIQQLGRDDLLKMLEGVQVADAGSFNNDAIARAYADGADPMAQEGKANPLRVQMLEELRRAGDDKNKRASIMVKYDRMAKEAKAGGS